MTRAIRRQVPLQLESIRNILTLRYDPDRPTFEKRLQLRDFARAGYDGKVDEKVESILKTEIRSAIGKAEDVAVPIGSGIDSAVIMTLAREACPEKNIFGVSLGFEGSQDETQVAKKICRAIGAECHVVKIRNVLQDLPLQIKIVGEPRWNLWYYHVLKMASELGAGMLLTGDGGDEVFAGYVFRYSKYLKMVRRQVALPNSVPESDARWTKRAWAYLQCHDRDWVPDQDKLFGEKLGGVFSWQSILYYFKPYFDNGLPADDLSQVFLADYNGKLIHDWIPTNARLSRHFSMRMTSPFLSDPIIEFAPHLPIEQKYDPATQEGKLVLRSILESHGILKHVGSKKLGFGMDLETLWHNHGSRIAGQYLEDAEICSEGLIDSTWLAQTLARLKKGGDLRYINKMLQLLSLEIWFRVSVSKSLSAETKLE